jgi:hypothetical protein
MPVVGEQKLREVSIQVEVAERLSLRASVYVGASDGTLSDDEMNGFRVETYLRRESQHENQSSMFIDLSLDDLAALEKAIGMFVAEVQEQAKLLGVK